METHQGNLFYKPKVLSPEKSAGTYLFFDTETTGLPRNWSAPVTDLNNWPRLVQIAFEFYKDGVKINSGDYIIKPEGFYIPEATANIHGITTARANEEGVALKTVLNEFKDFVEQSDFLVAHNMSFDEKIIGAEFLRNKMQDCLVGKNKICTKEISTDFCKIPSSNGKAGFKWPKLAELHYKLFGEEFEDSHNASADIRATAKCFWEMKRQDII